MSSLRDIHWLIATEISFESVDELIEKYKIDINQQDVKGRSLLFYMIGLSSWDVDVTLDFIKKYKPRIDVFDKYDQTIFFRFNNTIDTEFYKEQDVIHLLDVLLDMTPHIVLLKKNKKGFSVVEFLTQKLKDLNDKRIRMYPYSVMNESDESYYLIMDYRLRCLINRINQHINRNCSLFDMMFTSVNFTNKKERFH